MGVGVLLVFVFGFETLCTLKMQIRQILASIVIFLYDFCGIEEWTNIWFVCIGFEALCHCIILTIYLQLSDVYKYQLY